MWAATTALLIAVTVATIATCNGQQNVNVVPAMREINVVQGMFCGEGFRYDEKMGCMDINECLELAPCKIGQTCRNLYGKYMCQCGRGYNINEETGDCEDINECELGYCGGSEQCVNTDGSFDCICSAGMTKIGRFCRDINECIQEPCASNQYCINTRGSYKCNCLAGFEDAGNGTCRDTNECEANMCGALGERCVNTEGSYQCACQDGYTKKGRYCVDLDECELDMCPLHSECINTVGSFLCRCHRGFTKFNGSCVDNQECSVGEGKKCQWKCKNIPGSFECECPPGYYRNEFSCVDINECDVQRRKMSPCSADEMCVNLQGGHKCMNAEEADCPAGGFYRKLMKTDEFTHKQVTTNRCRRKCKKVLTVNDGLYEECKQQPLSISYHFVSVTSNLATPTKLLRMRFPARRRRQRYDFKMTGGDQDLFSIKQYNMYKPQAYLVLTEAPQGPSNHSVKIDVSTYNRRGEMRDNRMLTVTVFVSQYEF